MTEITSKEWASQKVQRDAEGWYWDPTHSARFETRADAVHNQGYWVHQATWS